jgi:hypothetical protein
MFSGPDITCNLGHAYNVQRDGKALHGELKIILILRILSSGM